ncbi:MAG: ABC transporter permease subunit [Burkholderiales bacterium]|nr:ABC transporter permease subunit [Anaerolineae bacterium]
MRGMWIVLQRELSAYLTSPVTYLISAALLFLTGFVFNNNLVLSITVAPASPASVPLFLSFTMVFFAPLLTMRMFAEEKREGTLELLLTAPVSDLEIVLGKFLGAWVFFSLLLLVTLSYQVILSTITQPDYGIALSSYLGIWLYGGATLAVGLLFSAITENQIVAAFLSMTVLLFMYLGDLAGQVVASIDLARIIRTLTLQGHFSTSFVYGLVRAEDVAYYAGIIVIMLYITVRVVESNRWR